MAGSKLTIALPAGADAMEGCAPVAGAEPAFGCGGLPFSPRGVARRGRGLRAARSLVGRLIHAVMQGYGVGGADVNRLDVAIVQVLGAHNMRNQGENDFVVVILFGLLGEQIFEERNGRQSWNSRQRLGLSVFKDTAHDVNFAFPEANFLFDLALPDHWLRNAADVLEIG